MESNKNMDRKIKKEFKDIEESTVMLITSTAQLSGKIPELAIKELVNQDYFCIYVSVNKPAKTIISKLDKKTNDEGRVFYIDCITNYVDGNTEHKESNILFIEPQDLTGLSVAVNELINSIEGKKCLIFDSMSALLIYNNIASIEKFSHFITNKIRIENIIGVMIDIIDQNNESISNLFKQVCDRFIKI